MDVEQAPFDEPFESAAAPLVVDLEGYEGPLDVLLALARSQKVDLAHISILALADQYLAFISEAKNLSLEIAADYLVMAAWLAYLKSRLLLPEDEGEPLSGPEMASRLAARLRRLEGMREAAGRLMARDRLGRDVFARGAPEGVRLIKTPVFEVSLYELLKAYGEQQQRATAAPLHITPRITYRVEDAYRRLSDMLGQLPDWQVLERFLPSELAAGFARRQAVSVTLAASLELARTGEIELRQAQPFGPIYVRKRDEGTS